MRHYLHEFILNSLPILTQNCAQLPSPVTSNSDSYQQTDNKISLCDPSFARTVYEVSVLLGCGAAILGDCFPTFPNSVMVSSSKDLCLILSPYVIRYLTMRATHCPHTSGNNRSVTRIIPPEEYGRQLYGCESRKSRRLGFLH